MTRSMKNNRTSNGIRNILIVFGSTIFNIIFQFVNRAFFVRLLSTEYLGINGLFTDILSVLALSELGVGSAMMYALYKPVAENDTEKIKSIMQLYKKLYRGIGIIILVVGTVLTPFLQYLIKEMPDIPMIRVYYLLYLINSAISYFLVYKKTLIICNQEEYVTVLVSTSVSVLCKTMQIIFLFLTRNFLVYLLIQICFSFLENLINSFIADKKYNYLKSKDVKPLDKEDVNEIKKNIKAMMTHKIGTVVVNSTDSIVMSKLLGLTVLGIYSNYNLIIYNISSILRKVLWSLNASVGNMVAEGNKERSEKIFNNILFAAFWVYSFCATAIYTLVQPFITLWVGKNTLFNQIVVLVLVICFFLEGIRLPALIMRDVTGVFYNDRYKPLLEASVNLLTSIPLTIIFGIIGVKLGTIISYVFVAIWIESYVLYKNYFKKSVFPYLIKLLFYFLLMILLCVSTNYICGLYQGPEIYQLFIRGGICCIFPNLVLFILFRRKEEFTYLANLAKGILHKIKRN